MLVLPDEVIVAVCSSLDCLALRALLGTCKRLRVIVLDPFVWSKHNLALSLSGSHPDVCTSALLPLVHRIDCSNLTPEGLLAIISDCFPRCLSLTDIVLPDVDVALVEDLLQMQSIRRVTFNARPSTMDANTTRDLRRKFPSVLFDFGRARRKFSFSTRLGSLTPLERGSSSFWTFSMTPKKTPKEYKREIMRLLVRVLREVDRQLHHERRNGLLLRKELTKVAKQGDSLSMQILAREVVRAEEVGPGIFIKTQLQATKLQIQAGREEEWDSMLRGMMQVLKPRLVPADAELLSRLFGISSVPVDLGCMDCCSSSEDSSMEDFRVDELLLKMFDSGGLTPPTPPPTPPPTVDDDELMRRLEALRN